MNQTAEQKNVQQIQASQLHYTSCQYGLAGHSGFQTRAMTADIDGQSKTAIEQLAVYEPPKNLPREPDDATTMADYPVAYRHLYLADGTLAITRSAYTGLDYTERGGNYFCHGLVFEQIPDGLWPVDLYEHNLWKHSLTAAEDCQQDHYDLPKATIEVDASAYDFVVLQEFLTDINQAQHILGNMIQAVLLKAQTSRTLVIRDPMASNGVFWLACLQKSFPASLQRHLSCSSYQFDPRSCAAINVVYGQTDVLLGENERKFQFYAFDLVDQQFSDVDTIAPIYAQTIANWMVNEPETLRAFHQMASQFDLTKLDTSLTPLVQLFMLQQKHEQELKQALDVNALMDIVDLVNGFAAKEYLVEIVEILSAHQPLLTRVTDPQMLEKVTLFFINSYQINRSQTIKLMIIGQLSRLTMLSVTSPEVDPQWVASLRQKAAEADKDIVYQTAQSFLSETNMAVQANKMTALLIDQMINLAEIMVGFIQTIEPNTTPLHSPQWHDFIALAISKRHQHMNDADWLFAPFTSDNSTVAKIILMICQKLPKLVDAGLITAQQSDTAANGFSQYLTQRFDKTPQDWFIIVNLLKSKQQSWDLLKVNWHQGFDNSRNKPKYYQQYFQAVLNDESDYRSACWGKFADILWQKSNEKQRLEIALDWLRNGHVGDLGQSLAEQVVQQANQAIRFSIKHPLSDEIASLIPPLIAKYDIALKPDKLTLRQALMTQRPFRLQPLEAVNTALQGADKAIYNAFIDVYLPLLLDSLNDIEQHGKIIGHLHLSEFTDVFIDAYRKTLSTNKTASTGRRCEGFLTFWLLLNNKHPFYRQCHQVKTDLSNVLVAKLAKLKDRELTTMAEDLKASGKLSDSQQTALDNLMLAVEDKKNTFLRKIGRTGLTGAKAVASLTKSGLNKLYTRVKTKVKTK